MTRLPAFLLLLAATSLSAADLRTWDGRHSIQQIDVRVVYFVPKDRAPLPDWRDRVDYFRRRIEQFHLREFQGQSTLATSRPDEPFISDLTTGELREGDGDAIFFRTLREVDARLDFAPDPPGDGETRPFPILLVLSEINWRPLDDFYRLKPGLDGPEFEGNYHAGQHFPGAESGGARATYLAREGKGWGLVSADGWRVPYRGSDCVVYHEGCGHTVGLPHPEPGNGSVMSLGQYQGWISESWLDRDQKARLGWSPPETEPELTQDLFTHFRALPDPVVPQPGEAAGLHLDWPAGAIVRSLRVRVQTDVHGPWVELGGWDGRNAEPPPQRVELGRFDRPAPVSYRVDAQLADGQTVEQWGYFQVRAAPDVAVIPDRPLPELAAPVSVGGTDPLPDLASEIDLLSAIDPMRDAVRGDWHMVDGRLESPKQYGARLEIPVAVPAAYELTIITEPLDAPNALNLGQVMDGRQFVVLLNYAPMDQTLNAIENVDGRNVGNFTTRHGALLKQGRLSLIQVRVEPGRVRAIVDGCRVIDWTGDASRLSLSDYWSTPNKDRLLLGAYDCRYRFHRVTLRSLRD